MKKIVIISLILNCLFLNILLAADEYESVYQIPLEVPYCSNVAEGGVKGKYPCGSESYLHWEIYKGFNKQWDPNDSKRKCQKAEGLCPDDGSGLIQYGLFQVADSYTESLTSDLFRYYIPKGTKLAALALYGPPKTGKCATIARFGKPPVSQIPQSYEPFAAPLDYEQYFPTTQYKNGRQDLWGGKTIDQLKQDDWFAVNEGGHITVLSSNNEALETGSWLYIKFISYDSSVIPSHKFLCYSDEKIYTKWFNEYSDANLFDKYGDPKQFDEPVKPEKPVITPVNAGELNQQGETLWITTPQTLKVSSFGADNIYYTITKAENGTIIEEPRQPKNNDYDKIIVGSSGTIELNSISGKLTRYRIRIVGSNSLGLGTESDLLKYLIDLTPKIPKKPVSSPGSVSVTYSPLELLVTSIDSTKIYYELQESQNPTLPNDKSKFISGPKGKLQIEGIIKQKKIYNIVFMGYNENGGGFGECSEIFTYTIDLTPKPPGEVNVTPESGQYPTPKNLTLSSDNATKIFVESLSTIDGTEPYLPECPTTSTKNIVNGSTGTYLLQGQQSKMVWTKLRFRGYNDDAGLGPCSKTYEYKITINNALPGQPQASEASGKVFTVTPQRITVTSSGAQSIYYKYEMSENGVEPPNPTFEIGGGEQLVKDNQVELYGTLGLKTIYKIVFIGQNSSGLGAESIVYMYTIDLTNSSLLPGKIIVSPDATANPFTSNIDLIVTSSNAEKIFVEINTTDGTIEPVAPIEPTKNSELSLNGPKGIYSLVGTAGKKVWYKVRFRGYNSKGYGTSSESYLYKIELSSNAIPEKPTVDILTGTVFKAEVSPITVTSNNAEIIYYDVSTALNTEPNAPDPPSTNPLKLSSLQKISNKGQVLLQGVAGQKKIFKYIFRGYNSNALSKFGDSSDVYTYTIDLTTNSAAPGDVIVKPDSGNINPNQIITVTSNNATKIYVEKTQSITESDPINPTEPNDQSEEIALIGSNSGQYSISIPSGATKIITKVRFRGYNKEGFGNSSQIYVYKIDLTSSSAPEKPNASPDDSITYIKGIAVEAISANADKIYYNICETDNGTEPTNPVINNSPLQPGQLSAITYKEKIPLNGEAGKKSIYKLIFRAKKGELYSEDTKIYRYVVDLSPIKSGTITQNQAKSNPDVNITNLIVDDKKLTNPSQIVLIASNTQSATEEKYSIIDLIGMYFKTDYPKLTIAPLTFESGNVLVISDPGWNGYVFPFVVDKLFTSSVEKAAGFNQYGNLDITMNNIRMSLSPAGASEDQLSNRLKDNNMNIAYSGGHTGIISVGGSDQQFVVRYQLGAQLPEEVGHGLTCELHQNKDGSIQIVYGDKTIQNLIPYIHSPESFIESMKGDAFLDCSNGTVHLPKWAGLPSYEINGSQTSGDPVTLYEGTDLIFKSQKGSQLIEYGPNYFK